MDFTSSTAERTTLAATLAGTIATGGSTQTAIVDVRDAVSFYLGITATVSGASTDWDPIEVLLTWYDNASGSNIIYVDQHAFFSDSSAGAALVAYGRFSFEDAHHGPFLRVQLRNVGPDSVVVAAQLVSTTRALTQPYANHGTTVGDLFLISPTVGSVVIAGGGQREIPARYGFGPGQWRISTSQAFTLQWFAAGEANAYDSLNSGGGGTFSGTTLGPKRAMLAQIQNGAGVANNVFIRLIQEVGRV